MSTRGQLGFRLDGKFLGTYNHSDSYPSWLGRRVVEFVSSRLAGNAEVEAFRKNLSAISWVESDGKPKAKDVRYYMAFAETQEEEWRAVNMLGRTRMKTEWYALLRDWQGVRTLEGVASGELKHLPENASFIRDSLFCEYAYVLDLDRRALEFWEGYQQSPQEGNPLGVEPDGEFYPCAKVGEVPFAEASLDALNQAYKLEGERAVA